MLSLVTSFLLAIFFSTSISLTEPTHFPILFCETNDKLLYQYIINRTKLCNDIRSLTYYLQILCLSIMDANDTFQQLKNRKKKFSKGGSVPIQNLGFRPQIHAGIIDPRSGKKSRIRNRKKYTAKLSKENFLSRMRMIVDIDELPEEYQNHLFKVTSIKQWKYVKKVLYRTREIVHCSICLQQNVVAPQITYCGHIYCFHCILMHFNISLMKFCCPVCKQSIDKIELKTCEFIFQRQFEKQDEITFHLKYRQGHYIYEADTLREDLNSTPIIRMRTAGIIPSFENELLHIENQLQKTKKTDRNFHYLQEAKNCALQKISNAKQRKKHGHFKVRQNEVMQNYIILRIITQQEKEKFTTFYQEKSGTLLFLHKLCKKYLKLQSEIKNQSITSKILEKLEVDLEQEQKDYKELPVSNYGTQIDIVAIDLKQLISQANNNRYIQEIEQILLEREEHQKKQQLELEKLRIQYEEQQKYILKLKQQQESVYYSEVKLPPTLDPSEINQYSFPSLISNNSNNSEQNKQMQIDIPTIKTVKTETQAQKKFDLSKEIQSFPEISNFNSIKSQGPKNIANGKKKKKKQKFVDVTHQFLYSQNDEDYN